eukprot:gnl/TRDRNA2_/TRDRNA2_194255_c0_seq1.p1 gnl/TRDRNA2_/TRDRNA2_194255_c0~~gnl/TRDRNA2_/TRDRNA2_194255_c0_seq1.p1  ORF type:complete len:314 (+),score=67.92 gnl/TRDRNA2_/TRDRNA2_194255_c0_seq1:77-1018(+)
MAVDDKSPEKTDSSSSLWAAAVMSKPESSKLLLEKSPGSRMSCGGASASSQKLDVCGDDKLPRIGEAATPGTGGKEKDGHGWDPIGDLHAACRGVRIRPFMDDPQVPQNKKYTIVREELSQQDLWALLERPSVSKVGMPLEADSVGRSRCRGPGSPSPKSAPSSVSASRSAGGGQASSGDRCHRSRKSKHKKGDHPHRPGRRNATDPHTSAMRELKGNLEKSMMSLEALYRKPVKALDESLQSLELKDLIHAKFVGLRGSRTEEELTRHESLPQIPCTAAEAKAMPDLVSQNAQQTLSRTQSLPHIKRVSLLT